MEINVYEKTTYLVGNDDGFKFLKKYLDDIDMQGTITFLFTDHVNGINSSFVEGMRRYLKNEKKIKNDKIKESIRFRGTEKLLKEFEMEWY